jgi:hypothetical protein
MTNNESNVNKSEHLKVVATDPTDPDEAFLASIRLDPAQIEAVVKIPVTLQCRKPARHEFVRVHPTLQMTVGAIELKDDTDGGLYLVGQAMVASLGDELKMFVLRPYINKIGTMRLWPIRQPDPDGKHNEWHRSAATAAARAVEKWVRITSNRDLGGYELFEAVNQGAEPTWPPGLDLAKMMKLAFADRGRVVDSPEHPLVKQLYGRL